MFCIGLHYSPCCTSLSVYAGIYLWNRFIHGWISSKASIQTQNRFLIQTHKHTYTWSVTGECGVLSCEYSHWSHSHWEPKDKHRLLLVLCICISIYYVSMLTYFKSFQFPLCLMKRFQLLSNTWAPRIRGLRSWSCFLTIWVINVWTNLTLKRTFKNCVHLLVGCLAILSAGWHNYCWTD